MCALRRHCRSQELPGPRRATVRSSSRVRNYRTTKSTAERVQSPEKRASCLAGTVHPYNGDGWGRLDSTSAFPYGESAAARPARRTRKSVSSHASSRQRAGARRRWQQLSSSSTPALLGTLSPIHGIARAAAGDAAACCLSAQRRPNTRPIIRPSGHSSVSGPAAHPPLIGTSCRRQHDPESPEQEKPPFPHTTM